MPEQETRICNTFHAKILFNTQTGSSGVFSSSKHKCINNSSMGYERSIFRYKSTQPDFTLERGDSEKVATSQTGKVHSVHILNLILMSSFFG